MMACVGSSGRVYPILETVIFVQSMNALPVELHKLIVLFCTRSGRYMIHFVNKQFRHITNKKYNLNNLILDIVTHSEEDCVALLDFIGAATVRRAKLKVYIG